MENVEKKLIEEIIEEIQESDKDIKSQEKTLILAI